MTADLVEVSYNGITKAVPMGTKLSTFLEKPLVCGGHGKCGKCKVLAKGFLSPVSENEKKLLSQEEITTGIRLACSATVQGPCDVQIFSIDEGREQILTQAYTSCVENVPLFSSYGVAVDIGTTTLAAKLFDVSGRELACAATMNPQSKWGADVISRMEAAAHGEATGLALCIRRAVNKMIRDMAENSFVPEEEINAVVLTGNTAMLYLLTGTTTEPLLHAPFSAARLFGEFLTAEDIGLNALRPKARIYLPPCISAFVGADIVCAILSTQVHRANHQWQLLVDIGTNGEMALCGKNRIMVCSTAAGPAFEGGGISMGMQGTAGAVDHVSWDGKTLHAHVIGELVPVGICGSGLIDAVASLLECGSLDESGFLENAPITVADPVKLTQNDIRMVQLAKSAVCAGIQTLMDSVGLGSENIASFLVAGGFGNYMDIQNACRIGLIPQSLQDRAQVVGNAALSGACQLLLCKDMCNEAVDIVSMARVVPLDSNPIFAEYYVSGMLFDQQ